jgi:peptidoglycan/xylan/chitin deacetylase (PgdA/CDA1 family)
MSAYPSSEASVVKRVMQMPFSVPGLAKAFSVLTGTHATIFLFHRFSAPDLGISGHDPAVLRDSLAHLRKQKYDLISLRDLFSKLREGEPLRRAVAFTIDDGYIDHAQVAAPIFAEYDCPVTTFLVTDFVEGKTWFWWDKIAWIFDGTQLSKLRARLGDAEIEYVLDSPEARAAACNDLNLRCQDASESERLNCVMELSRTGDVELPGSPPARLKGLSWDDARKLEKQGMTFGPHTVTHPILSSTSAEQSEFEITESWKRLSAEVTQPVPIFCYPNGRNRDYGQREIDTIRRLELWGAVVADRGFSAAALRSSDEARFRVLRYGYRDSVPYLLQCVSGLEAIKSRIRRSATPSR